MDLWFKVLSWRQKMDSEYLNGWKHLDEKKDEHEKKNWFGWAWKVPIWVYKEYWFLLKWYYPTKKVFMGIINFNIKPNMFFVGYWSPLELTCMLFNTQICTWVDNWMVFNIRPTLVFIKVCILVHHKWNPIVVIF
jgi:hypothetical protein